MATVILVHGGWCWHRVVEPLELAGHRVLAPDLPGHGIDMTAPADIRVSVAVDRLCLLIDQAEAPVVLVGHSFGGIVISQVAERRPHSIARLVYVTAFLLRSGQTTADVRAEAGVDMPAWTEADPKAGLLRLDMTQANLILFGDSPPEARVLAGLLSRPEHLAFLKHDLEISNERWGKVERHYIECTRDRALPLALQRTMQRHFPCRTASPLAADHSPFFSAPAELADLLLSLAR